MSNPIIERALAETVWRYSQTIAPGFHPNRYHTGTQVKEADLVFHFVNALEQHCALPISYREFSSDGLRVDAVVVAADSLYVIEAKGTLEISQGLARLEEQVRVLDDPSHSLRFYLVDNIVYRFRAPEWGSRSIQHLWGITLTDTFQVAMTTLWENLNGGQYPTLASYTRSVQECLRYRVNGQAWFILSGYKELSAYTNGILYTGVKQLTRE
jgi:hypothetical protein